MSGEVFTSHRAWRGVALAIALAGSGLGAVHLAAEEQRSTIQLPAQSLAQALNELARQTGSNIIVSGALTAGRQAPALSGRLSVEEALGQLLRGTDLQARPASGGSFVIVRAAAEQAYAPVLSKVVVTGSNIRRADSEGTSSVQVITAEQLEKSGKQTVADLLRSLPSNSGKVGENSNENWAVGAAGVGLHGLAPKNTLVLLNGRRVANNAMASGALGNAFVDINSLPTSALERVEVLRDGASAVYGSDAVAGVVNLITRQSYQGLKAKANTGAATEGGAEQNKVAVFGGTGDLKEDGYNLFFSFDGYTRNRLDQSDRDLTKSGDYRDKPGGGMNGWSAQGARIIQANGSSVPLLDANGNCPAGTTLMPSAPIDGRAGNTCAYSLTSELGTVAGAERYQLFSSGTFALAGNTELFVEGLYNHTHGNYNWYQPYYTQAAGNLAINPLTGLPETIANTLPAASPNNPYGQDVNLDYTFFNLGQASRNTSSDFYRLLTGLRGEWHGWEWEGGLFHSSSQVEERRNGGQVNRYALAQALLDGSYNLANPDATPQSVLDGIRLNTLKEGRSELSGVDFKFTNTLFEGPAGPVDFAGGVEWRRETQDVNIPWQMSSGIMARPHIQRIDGERNVSAAYGEFNVPLSDTLEFQLAARADHYSDVGAAFSPKYSLRWQPVREVLVRASASRGFRAPSLSESGSDNRSITNGAVYDPAQGKRVSITGFMAGNDDLEPEHTKTYSLGVVLSPDELTNISIDYYKVSVDDVIAMESADAVVARGNPADIVRDSQGFVTGVYSRFQNLSELSTSGFDVEASRRFPLGTWGDLNLATSLTYIKDYRVPQTVGGRMIDISGSNINLVAMPRLKANTRLGWSLGDWRSQLTWNYTGGYQQDAVASVNGIHSRVNAFNTFDAYLGYAGFKDLTLYTSIENLENKMPPYDPLGYTVSGLTLRAPYDARNNDLIGRYVRVGVEYTFF